MGGCPGLSKWTLNITSALTLKREAETWVTEGDLRSEEEIGMIQSLKAGKGKEIDSP